MLGKGKSLLKKSLRWQVVAGLVCLLLVPLIIVATGCGGGGGGPTQPTQPPRLIGQVVDATNPNVGVGNLDVEVSVPSKGRQQQSIVEKTKTDSEGRFQLFKVESGKSYTFKVSDLQGPLVTVTLTIAGGSATVAIQISVVPRDKQQQIQQQQQKQLVWEKRPPDTMTVGQTVDFKAYIKLGNLTLLPVWEVDPPGSVAVLGEYLHAIQKGTVTLQARMPTTSMEPVGEKVTITVEEPSGGQQGSIFGIVLDQSASPVANVTVQALKDSTVKASSVTNTLGQFLLANLPAGTYTIVAKQTILEATSSVTVEAGKTASVTLQLSPVQQNNPVTIAKSIVQMLRDFGVSAKDLPETEATNINAALAEQQTVISSEIKIAQEFLDRINFPKRVLGWDNLENNPGLSTAPVANQPTTVVRGTAYNDLSPGSVLPNARVEAYIGSQRVASTTTDLSGNFSMQLPIAREGTKVAFVVTSGALVGAITFHIDPGEERVIYPSAPQSDLLGLPPGKYRELWTNNWRLPRILERIGDAPDNKTWIVEATEGNEKGLVLTVTVQNPIGIFRYTHEAGKYTFQVRKPNDATIQYDGSIAVTTDAQGNPTQIALSATVKDSKLSSPITFSGTLQGTPAQTGTVSGSIRSRPVNRSPVVARRQRGRQSQDNPYAPYTEAKFVNVSLQSQFGNASIGELKVVWMRDSLDDEKIKQISLTGLTVRSQTSKPASLTVSSVSVEFRETTQQEKQLSPDVEDLTPTKATVSATLEGSGIRLQVSNLQASEFKWVKVGEKSITVYLPIPTTLNGQVSYSSPTVQFNGSIDAKWENPQSDPKDFGGEDSPVALVEVPKGTVKLAGNWVPKIGRPASIQVNFTSNPTGNAPQVQMNLTIKYGDQKLAGTITGTLDIKNNQSYGFKSGNLDMTHTPSNFKVQVSWERDKPVSGKIVTAQGQKVADIGEARNLDLPDLGDVLIVKYSDNTFETLESVLPRSRLGRK
jgi:hypothetical protein